MSVETQIERLNGIKSAIRTSLVNKGISASSHNMADFANDIDNISVGIDVSDTTATASDVLSGAYFYNKNGNKTQGNISRRTDSGIVTLNPSIDQVNRKYYGSGYYASQHGVEVPAASALIPSVEGTPFESGLYLTGFSGYAYSERPESVKQGSGTTTTANANYTVDTGLSTINGFVLFSDGASYDGLVAYIPNVLGSDNYAFSSIYVTNNSGGMQTLGTDGTARTHTIMAVNGGIVTMKTRGTNTLGSYKWVAW